ncbi:MAG: phage major capsid protein, partial [Clostridiaceae bacterium]|nr:phage major capsid protein [Clostridiaceae bacterium]
MKLAEIRERLDEIRDHELDREDADLDKLEIETRSLLEKKAVILEKAAERKAKADYVTNLPYDQVKIIKTFGRDGDDNPYRRESMENKDIEMRAFQKYITTGVKGITEAEERALNLSGAAAVLPVDVHNTLITSEKYSDLLNRATIINQGGAGKIYIPIASNTAASWKVENTDQLNDASIEASPTLTKLELGGYELMRLMQISGASASMTVSGFTDLMLQLLASEVTESLEKSFISGTGIGQPKGLDELTWTPNTNQVVTASAATAIGAGDIATALSLLPQKYARNAIILMNSDMLYNVSQFFGTAEYAYNLADGATAFLGKQIVVSEHMADDTVYIVDPKELYVRFADQLAIEADKSA